MSKSAVNFALVKDGCILLEWREDRHFHPGCWSIPGGKIEDREAPEAAFYRELDEELGITALKTRVLWPILSGTWTIYPVLITEWEGDVPEETDAGDHLAWFKIEDISEDMPIWLSARRIVLQIRDAIVTTP